MSKLKIWYSNGNHLINIESGCENLWLTRDEGMELLERLPSVLAEMPVSYTPPVIHADPEPEERTKGPR